MQVRDAIRKNPVTIAADATMGSAAELMDHAVVGCLVVLDGDRPVGIVTDRDLVVRGLARRLPWDSRIDSVMSTELVTLDVTEDMHAAVHVFSEHPIRRLPVMDGGRMVGMLTIDDIVINTVNDLNDVVRPLTAQVLFGHAEPGVPARAS